MEVPIRQVAPDQAQVSNYGQVLHNVVVTETGTRLRPGSQELVDIGEGSKVNGIYDWDAQNMVIVTSGNKVFSVGDEAGVFCMFFSCTWLNTGARSTPMTTPVPNVT